MGRLVEVADTRLYVEERGAVTHPVLVLGGRHDRTCAVGASQDMARGCRTRNLSCSRTPRT